MGQRNPHQWPTLFKKKEVMKRIKKIFRIKKETATATPKMEKAMLPKMEKRSK